jgi:hypothetical protein
MKYLTILNSGISNRNIVIFLLCFLFLSVTIFPNILLAQSNQSESAGQQFSMNKYTIDSGSATSTSNDYQIIGTIAQPDTSEMQSSDFVIRGGFWSSASELDSDLIFSNGFEN